MLGEKRAILLVAFGTSDKRASRAIANIFSLCRHAFPGWEIRLSYASQKVRETLKGEGESIDGPILAIARLAEEGFRRVVVQPLCVLPGSTFRFVACVCEEFARLLDISGKPLFSKLSLGKPLIASLADCGKMLGLIAAAYGEHVPDQTTALVLVAHGSAHVTGSLYATLHLLMQEHLGRNFFLGALEGLPSLESILQGLEALRIRKVVLAPFMLVAGSHLRRDVAGGGMDSWEARLRERGFEVSVICKGLGEYEPFARFFLWRVQEAMEVSS